MTIKIEATRHDLAKIKELAKSVDLVLNVLGTPSSWRDVMSEVQKLLAEAEIREAGPLIKDDKIRKAVRAWAEANNAGRVDKQNNYCLSTEEDADEDIVFCIPIFKDLDHNVSYTITELCGEEER